MGPERVKQALKGFAADVQSAARKALATAFLATVAGLALALAGYLVGAWGQPWLYMVIGGVIGLAGWTVIMAVVLARDTRRSRAALVASLGDVPRGIIDFMADAHAANLQMSAALNRSNRCMLKLSRIAIAAGPQFERTADPIARRRLAQRTARKMLRVAARMRPLVDEFTGSVDGLVNNAEPMFRHAHGQDPASTGPLLDTYFEMSTNAAAAREGQQTLLDSLGQAGENSQDIGVAAHVLGGIIRESIASIRRIEESVERLHELRP